MKYTLCVTQQCNLRCTYCYVVKHDGVMPLSTARHIVDFAFAQTPPEEKVDIGFFGGEPLLAVDRIREIVDVVENHPQFDPARVEMAVVSNGTRFSQKIVDLLLAHRLVFGISCDGPPAVQDTFRRFADGRGSGAVVEQTLRQAMAALPALMVNAVYHPRTLHHLPRTVAYFSDLGVRQIFLNADFTAPWTAAEAAQLPEVYDRLRAFYIRKHLEGDAHFIGPLDTKVAVILRGGYRPEERCRMGRGEYAFSVDGYIYPCERLVGAGDGGGHCIGHIDTGVDLARLACHPAAQAEAPSECGECGVREYCMHWCACSNAMATGSYARPGPFLCASERAAIEAARGALERLGREEAGLALLQYVTGEFAPGTFRPRPSREKGGVTRAPS